MINNIIKLLNDNQGVIAVAGIIIGVVVSITISLISNNNKIIRNIKIRKEVKKMNDNINIQNNYGTIGNIGGNSNNVAVNNIENSNCDIDFDMYKTDLNNIYNKFKNNSSKTNQIDMHHSYIISDGKIILTSSIGDYTVEYNEKENEVKLIRRNKLMDDNFMLNDFNKFINSLNRMD